MKKRTEGPGRLELPGLSHVVRGINSYSASLQTGSRRQADDICLRNILRILHNVELTGQEEKSSVPSGFLRFI